MDPVAEDVLRAIERRDRARLRTLLHPYVHWTDVDGRSLRGRNHVLTHLESGAAAAPASLELRDGQIYRWTAARS